MRTHLISALLGAWLVLSSAPLAAEPASPFTLPTRDGEVSLAAQRGKVVYLDFWASWCGPCRESFPWMDAMAQRYARDGLVVIAVNLDRRRELAQSFLKQVPVGFTIAYDPESTVARTYGVKGMPTAFLIGRDGEVKVRHAGFRESDAVALEAEIRAALGLAP